MEWVTRVRPKIDRVACPWLIRWFIDRDTEILYVPAGEAMDTAELESATFFDMSSVELGHHTEECSFDAIIHAYQPKDPALLKLVQIVRAVDTLAKELAPEATGLESITEGFRLLFNDDLEMLDRELVMYDALYAYCRSALSAEVLR
jgi:hypothetical protein